ncbi:MAG TPA: GNAT family N-acetyltransferase [Candidatus Solibacter sp.]|nr:GNAT family N-acetyltransferase [Candidatus Solibacter sp.]
MTDLTIETARLAMRPLVAGDIDDIVRLYGDAEVTRYLANVHTIEMAQAWLDQQVASWARHGRIGMFRVADRESGEFLGRCGVRDLDDSGEMEVGYAFVRTAWGRGIATEACRAVVDATFKNSDLDHIAGITFPENASSKKVLTNCGLRYVREDHFWGVDASYFSISREEWQKMAGTP